MKLLYLTHMRLPTEKAYGLQMVNTCKAFADKNVTVTLLLAHYPNAITQNIYHYYGFDEKKFLVVYFQLPYLWKNTKAGFWFHMLLFSKRCFLYTIKNRQQTIYSREPLPLLFYSLLGYQTIYEMHDFPVNSHWFHGLVCRLATKVVVTNTWAKERCRLEYGLSEEKLILTPNGYDDKLFLTPVAKTKARQALAIPVDQKIVMYSGHLYDWKGVEIILALGAQRPDIQFMFVGGAKVDQAKLRLKYPDKNISFIPHLPPGEVPLYLQAADILVLPNIPINQHSEFSTSPIKLFEYMAARRPVIASQLPSLAAVVSEQEVFFAPAGDVAAWDDTIQTVFSNPVEVKKRVEAAALLALNYTWDAKAATILKRLST